MSTPVTPVRASPAAPGPGAGALDWRASRLTIAFLLDVASLARGERHMLDSLLLSTIVQANVAAISQSADLQIAYADMDSAPPDEIRRPISINALASSLRLPFETARRRVRALTAEGLCVEAPGGVVVPTAVLTSPQYLREAFAAYERFRRYYYELRGAGALHDLPEPTVDLAGQMIPLRAVARLGSDFVLRAIDAITNEIGDLMDGLILLQIDCCNTEIEPLPGAPADEDPAEAFRTPARARTIAARLGLPYETVRRHVARLERDDFCVRAPGGLLVRPEVIERESVRAAMAAVVASAHRMFASFGRLGVLQAWDAQPDAPSFGAPPLGAGGQSGQPK